MRYWILSLALIASSAACVPATRSGGRSTTQERAAFTSRCRGDFGASPAAAEFEAFMSATYELHEAASQTSSSLRDACAAMAQELGVTVEATSSGVEGTRAVCEQVASALRTEMAAIREGTDLTAELRARPPRCEASFDAYADCAASCDVSVQPAQVELACSGGEIRGGCSGTCRGSCAVEAEASCNGVCEGWCEGRCSATAQDGSCAGRCDGTCHGHCVAEVSAGCQGECRGRCDVEWERPYCTGHYEPAQVNADCRAACEARVDASMTCQRGEVELVVAGGPDAQTQARIERVRAAVRVGLAQVQEIHARAARLVQSSRAVVQHLENLPQAIREVGLNAAACSAGAISDLQASLASMTVTLEVTVTVSASVSASAG